MNDLKRHSLSTKQYNISQNIDYLLSYYLSAYLPKDRVRGHSSLTYLLFCLLTAISSRRYVDERARCCCSFIF